MIAPWKESYDQPRQHIQNRDITLPTKVHLVKAMVFPVVMYGCESWTVKKAECQSIGVSALASVLPVADFIFLGSKITSCSDYSHEIKR